MKLIRRGLQTKLLCDWIYRGFDGCTCKMQPAGWEPRERSQARVREGGTLRGGHLPRALPKFRVQAFALSFPQGESFIHSLEIQLRISYKIRPLTGSRDSSATCVTITKSLKLSGPQCPDIHVGDDEGQMGSWV